MTLNDIPKKHHEVALEWFKGATIECRHPNIPNDKWEIADEPCWYEELEYRVSVEVLPVRDGFVKKTDCVWWHCEHGPQRVDANEHWFNIQNFPKVYSIMRPKIAYVY